MQNINFRITHELQDVNSEYGELRIGRKKVRILEFIFRKSDFLKIRIAREKSNL